MLHTELEYDHWQYNNYLWVELYGNIYILVHKHTHTASGGCITCGDNVCGQLGRRCEKGDRNPAVVTSLRGQKVEKVACGDFFTVAATAGKLPL